VSFIVDGSEWSFDGWTTDQISSSIEDILGLVDVSRERDETVWISDDFQSRPMRGEMSLWEFVVEDGIAPEIRQELAAWLGAAPDYFDGQDHPSGWDDTWDIAIGDDPPAENVDLAWVHHSVRGRKPTGCLSLVRSGCHRTHSTEGEACVFWVRCEADRLQFWRDAIVLQGDDLDSLKTYSSHAYPDLYFHLGVLGNLAGLPGGYPALRTNVRSAFSTLNDDGCWAFTASPPALSRNELPGPDLGAAPTNQNIETRFRGLGLILTPENPNVYADRNGRQDREIQIAQRTLYCGWHLKLEPHRNRIHVHPPVPESGNRLIIAIISEHLYLP
jgi:hypothetical protein